MSCDVFGLPPLVIVQVDDLFVLLWQRENGLEDFVVLLYHDLGWIYART